VRHRGDQVVAHVPGTNEADHRQLEPVPVPGRDHLAEPGALRAGGTDRVRLGRPAQHHPGTETRHGRHRGRTAHRPHPADHGFAHPAPRRRHRGRLEAGPVVGHLDRHAAAVGRPGVHPDPGRSGVPDHVGQRLGHRAGQRGTDLGRHLGVRDGGLRDHPRTGIGEHRVQPAAQVTGLHRGRHGQPPDHLQVPGGLAAQHRRAARQPARRHHGQRRGDAVVQHPVVLALLRPPGGPNGCLPLGHLTMGDGEVGGPYRPAQDRHQPGEQRSLCQQQPGRSRRRRAGGEQQPTDVRAGHHDRGGHAQQRPRRQLAHDHGRAGDQEDPAGGVRQHRGGDQPAMPEAEPGGDRDVRRHRPGPPAAEHDRRVAGRPAGGQHDREQYRPDRRGRRQPYERGDPGGHRDPDPQPDGTAGEQSLERLARGAAARGGHGRSLLGQ
jgi:hypothetical protein